MAPEARWSFVAEYYDQAAALTRTYTFLYCPEDSSVEMHDQKAKRTFLKRCPVANLTPKEVFVGATVTVYGRNLHLTDYGDIATRNLLSAAVEDVTLLVSGAAGMAVGSLLTAFDSLELRVNDLCLHTPEDGRVRQPTFAIALTGKDAKAKVEKAIAKYPAGSAELADASQAALRLQPRDGGHSNSTMCVVKPHAILGGHGGLIVQRLIDEGFDIIGLRQYSLGIADAEDFLEVYKGVVPEYKKLVEHMSSGPIWAIEVRAENSVAALRALCGPHDPEICRVLFPNSLRALYGTDRVKNAVHCTDLPEEAGLESEFFFSLLPQKNSL